MRYAIYFAPPPDSAFHALGSRWLGRDAASGGALPQPPVEGIGDLTAEPRRYGFHATLKPPFALREGVAEPSLLRSAAALAADLAPFPVMLQVARLDGFLALTPRGGSDALDALAARCVIELDGFRRPPGAEELAARRKAPLSPAQEANLVRWGYPYVLDAFRFHMTLSGRLSGADAERLGQAAEAHFRPVLDHPVTIGAITLFQEAEPGKPFLSIRQFPFLKPTPEAAA